MSDMYTISNKIKAVAYSLMIVGFLGIVYGFLSAPNSVEEVKIMLAEESSHHIHDNSSETTPHRNHAEGNAHSKLIHYEHALHQMQNRPWSALYVGAFFVMMLSLGTLVFYASQRVARSGWSPLLFRVMEGISAYVFPGLLIIVLILVASASHLNHLFVWMDDSVMEHDKILQGKSIFLNKPFFLVRMVLYVAGWSLYRFYSRKFSIAQDTASDNSNYKKNFKISVFFLLFFFVTESMMSWDWVMSLDHHWFSTLFGWYIFAGMFVSGVTTIAMVTIYLKSAGYLEKVNDSHIHDLAKFMFGLSIFWTYLWFSQFMLIWYSNIPEEVTYFMMRFDHYKLLFFGMLGLNFVLPILILMNSDFKRVNWFVVVTGIIILLGHYIDVFVMIMPPTVGGRWAIGVSEISSLSFFMGLFIYIIFRALARARLYAKGNPFLKESEHFQY